MTITDNRLNKIRRFFREQRRMPSLAEVAELCGFKSKNAAKYLVGKLVAVGAVSQDGQGRLLPGRAFRPLKRLGTVEAGFPSPAEEEMTDTVSLDDWLLADAEASYMLRVSGSSMIEAGIMPGDMVILNRAKQAKNGDIVVAEVDKQWTIKYFERRGGKIVLNPANRAFKPIEAREEIRIAGVVTAVIRKLKS